MEKELNEEQRELTAQDVDTNTAEAEDFAENGVYDYEEIDDFIITRFVREITDEQIEALGTLGAASEEDIEAMKENKSCMAMRIEHKTGVFCVELPIYSNMFHIIESFGDDDASAKHGMLQMMMEDCTMIGDSQYIQDRIKAKKDLAERLKGGQ